MALTGHEERFRKLYADESKARLERMARSLLALESSWDAEALDAAFREAHTLKGGAAVVGLGDVSRVAHAFEEVLEPFRDRAGPLGAGVVDGLLDGLDRLTALIAASLHGADVAAEADAAVAAILSSGTAPGPEPPEPPPTPSASPASPAGAADTVRVPAERLDELVRLVGEATAAHRGLDHVTGPDGPAAEQVRLLGRTLRELSSATMAARLVPVADVTAPLVRAVRDAARATGKEVAWEVAGDDTELDRGVLERLADPLVHLVRNAVAHGIEAPGERSAAGKSAAGTVRLTAGRRGSSVVLTVTDDGRGVDLDGLRTAAAARGLDVEGAEDDPSRLLFATGVSTAGAVSDLAGRGVGLDAVRAVVEQVRGDVEVTSAPGVGTTFRLVVPMTVAIVPALILWASGDRYAVPLANVVATARTSPGEVAVPLSSVLGGEPGAGEVSVTLESARRRGTVAVDAVEGQADLTIQPLSPLLPALPLLAGVSVEADGSLLVVLDAGGIVAAAAAGEDFVPSEVAQPEAVGQVATVLVVDDTLAVREVQRAILERAGYRVRTAVDGADALRDLETFRSDLLLTDLEMPNMDGLTLVAEVRRRAAFDGLPVVVLTSRTDPEARQGALDAGADAFVVKSSFAAASLLRIVDDLLSPP